MKKFKLIWINYLFNKMEYPATFNNGKPATFKTKRQAETWARKNNTGLLAICRDYRVDPL